MDEQKPSLAEALGRSAGRLVKKARPAVERAASEALPKLQQTGREALDFAKEHEDELRSAAAKLARTRLTGPLGLVLDAVTANPMPDRPASSSPAGASGDPATLVCPACASANPPAARFCNQCGSPMGSTPPAQL